MAEIALTAPPTLPDDSGRRWVPAVAALLGVGALVALSTAGSLGSAATSFPVVLLVSALGSLVSLSYGFGGRGGQLDRNRDDYLTYLDSVAAQLTEARAAQRDQLLSTQPPSHALWAVMGTEACWRHRSGPSLIRVGSGTVEPALRPIPPAPEEVGRRVDPITERAVAEMCAEFAVMDGPVSIDLLAARCVSVEGPQSAARALVRAMLCQLAASHHPDAVRIATRDGDAALEWDWLKWFPHRGAHLVEVDDSGAPDRQRLPMAGTRIVIGPDPEADLRLVLAGDTLTITGRSGESRTATPDVMEHAVALACARRLSGIGLTQQPQSRSWRHLIGSHRRDLRIPLGTDDCGAVVELDIKESARGGMGPHGLCVGATGSGKSELLRTIALGMIAGHSSDDVNLILIDFKGGATFLGLERCRHVSAVITNLADEAHLVERMQDALNGEIHRRQRLLREAGNLGSAAEYRAQAVGTPLPTLLVMVDEFSELLTQHPEFIDVFVAIGRLGRSLGIHLLLACQRLDEGRLRGLDSHLSYRLCLKTLSAAESRAMLGVADAYELPAVPGAAYLKVGADAAVRFQTAYVSGPEPREVTTPHNTRLPTLFLAGKTSSSDGLQDVATPNVLTNVLAEQAGKGTPAHPVWLAPLRHSPALGELLATYPAGELRVPIGLVDRVFEQRRTPLIIDLSGAAGHVAVIGAPQSGKSSTLRCIALALAASHDASRIQLYCLDFGGGGLVTLADLPHVGCVATGRDHDLVTRTVGDLRALAKRRAETFNRHRIDSVAEYRHRRLAGELADGPDADYGDVFLLIDNWSSFRQERDDLESAITSLAADGLSLGIHVILASTRWADVRPALKDQIGTRVELRLADPLDSEIDRRAARDVPVGMAGRGLCPEGLPLAVAMPDGVQPRQAAGRRARRIAILPATCQLDPLVTDQLPSQTAMLGLDDAALAPVLLSFGDQPHLLVIGDRGSGKTTVLRTLATQLDPKSIVLVDPRDALPDLEQIERVTSVAQLRPLITELCADLTPRIERPAAAPDRFLIIDDYDLIATAVPNPLAPLTELLPHSSAIGLHIVIARRSAGAARAMYEPMLGAVRDNDAFGLQLSVSVDEGPLLAAGRPRLYPPGRGLLISRTGGEQLIQVAQT